MGGDEGDLSACHALWVAPDSSPWPLCSKYSYVGCCTLAPEPASIYLAFLVSMAIHINPAGRHSIPACPFVALVLLLTMTQPTSDHMTQPTSDHMTQPTSDHITQPTSDHMTQPTSDHMTQPTSDHMTQPTSDHMTRCSVASVLSE